jgi:subtilisin family serine protease
MKQRALRRSLWAVVLFLFLAWTGEAWAQDLEYSGWPRQTEQDHPKIQKFLLDLMAEVRAGRSPQLNVFSNVSIQSIQLEGNDVQVVMEVTSAAATSRIAENVQALGGRAELTYDSQVQAFVPVEVIEELADMDEVVFIRLPAEPYRAQSEASWLLSAQGPGSMVSEGRRVIGADLWNQAGVNGEGVKIGIADSGYRGYTGLLGRELPPREKVVTRSFRSDGDLECRQCSEGSQRHGLAVAEVIYDVAAGASFYMANARTDVEYRQAVDWLIDQKVDVINTSWDFPSGCFRPGGGIFEPQIAKARQNGILWAVAAGNEADIHYGGTFKDSNNNDRHEFSSNDETFSLEVELFEAQIDGQTVAAVSFGFILSWDADCTNATDDYDIVFFPDSQPSFRQQGDWVWRPGIPIKGAGGLFFLRNPDRIGTRDRWSVVIEKRNPDAPAARLDVLMFDCSICVGGDFQYIMPQGSVSILEPSISPNAMTVGAVHHSPSRCSRSICPDGRLLFYSSQGPTKDGRIKPDIAAPTHVSTTAFGRFTGHGQNQNRGFGGTSGATPHVAGAAALVKQAFPDFTPAQIQKFLEDRAEDSGAPGKDNLYGAGVLVLGQPPAPPAPTITSIEPASGVQGSTVQATISGTNLTGATAITFSDSGVTATIREGGTNTVLPITISITSDAAPGARTFSVTTPGGTAQSGAVTFTVERKAPQPSPLRAEPESLSFEAVVGEDNPAAQMLRLSFPSMGGSAVWKASVDAPWLMVDPAEGDLDFGASMDLSVSVEIAGLSAGTYNGRISFAVEGFEPLIVPVTLTLRSRPSTGELLVLAFKQLEFVNAGDWERTQREGCVIYTNVSDKPSLLRVTLPDDSVREFNIAAGKEVIVCRDVVHIDTR